jgi:hypothetical protein
VKGIASAEALALFEI